MKPFGEIIESSIASWKAQMWQFDRVPNFGSLVGVVADDALLIGVVTHISTGSSDPARVPFAYQKTHEELMRDQPHIFSFLQTVVQCVPVGILYNNKIQYTLPQLPPTIHAFMAEIEPAIAAQFLSSAAYVRILVAHKAQIAYFDELVLLLLLQAHERGLITAEYLGEFSQIMMLTGVDYRRLKLLCERVTYMTTAPAIMPRETH